VNITDHTAPRLVFFKIFFSFAVNINK
jgi:hypothetical protein